MRGHIYIKKYILYI